MKRLVLLAARACRYAVGFAIVGITAFSAWKCYVEAPTQTLFVGAAIAVVVMASVSMIIDDPWEVNR